MPSEYRSIANQARSRHHPRVESLDPKVVWYWRLSAIPRMIPALAMGIVVASVLPRSHGRMSSQMTVALIVIAGLGVVALWNVISARLRFRRFGFELAHGLLRVHHGIILRKEKTIPIDRMQHLDVDHGPIERIFGLARLSVFTAGGRAATFQLPGLSRARADSLRAQIVEQRDALVLRPTPQPEPGLQLAPTRDESE